jgi:aryl-alcohol dehydrogenase-like predicted oxidoreductase
MQYVNYPDTDEKVSALGLGTWVFGGENWGGAKEHDSLEVLRSAIELGVSVIDTAPFYGNGLAERLVGQFVKGCRSKVFLVTKCGLIREGGRVRHDLSAASILKEADQSLERLKTDVIDLYLCHWPDPQTPVEESMEAMLALQQKKKVRHIGVCNFDLELLRRAVKVAPVTALQLQYSLLERGAEKELMPFCVKNGIGVMAYGVMGGGILSGKYSRPPQLARKDARRMFYGYYEGNKFLNTCALLDQLKPLGRPLNQLALNWVRQQPGVMTTLAGCRNKAQVESNVASLEWDLAGDELTRTAEMARQFYV